VTAASVHYSGMMAADTLEQRLQRVFEQKDKVTVEDLLTAVQRHEDVCTFAWSRAFSKLIYSLDPKSQEFRDAVDWNAQRSRYRSVNTVRCASLSLYHICKAQCNASYC
jgi:hypothetical protein